MQPWLQQTPERRIEIINQVNAQTGFAVEAIEKDWWVTITLQAVTATPWVANLVFKGGTSLSKGWNLISRFSEDIDLAIDRSVLGFNETEPNGAHGQTLDTKRPLSRFTEGPICFGRTPPGLPGQFICQMNKMPIRSILSQQ